MTLEKSPPARSVSHSTVPDLPLMVIEPGVQVAVAAAVVDVVDVVDDELDWTWQTMPFTISVLEAGLSESFR